MFKHYLTYQFAENFDRTCCSLELPPKEKSELIRCSRQMLSFFSQAIRAQKKKDQGRWLYVALTYLRDCKDGADQARVESPEFESAFFVLQERLERMLSEVARTEGDQFRMLG